MIDPTSGSPRLARRGSFLAGTSCALVLATITTMGCGSSDSAGSPPADTGTSTDGSATDTSPTDGGKTDGAKGDGTTTDGGGDTLGDDAGAPPFGTKLAAGDFDVIGVTTDGYVIVVDNDSAALQAIPLAGGAAKTIDASADSAAIHGKVVFSWHGVDADNIGGLTTWTAASGPKTASTASFADIAAASDDATVIAYTDAATAAGPGNLVKSAIDASGKVTLDTVNLKGCGVLLARAGARFLSSYCTDAAGTGTVTSFDDAGTKATLLAAAKPFFAVDAAGTKVLVISSTEAASIVPLAGGTAIAIDTGVGFGAMRPDGTGVIYRSSATLKKATSTGTDLTTLVASGVGGFGDMSPDGNFTVFVGGADSTSGLTDAFLASTVTAGTPTTLNAAMTSDLSNFGSVFTTDSSHVLFATDVADDASGTLKVLAVTSGTPRTIGTAAWYALATTGAKVAFTDGYTAGTSPDPDRADLRVVDTAGSATPTLLQSNVNVNFALTTAKDKVVYTYTLVPAHQGLYVGALP